MEQRSTGARTGIALAALVSAALACGRTELFEPGDVEGPVADAGPSQPDAGPADAGGVDAGSVDAGGNDAGPADAGVTDAGVTDAGGHDAGPDACPFGFGATTTAQLGVTADNQRAVWVNGVNVERTTFEWFTATSPVVVLWRHPSRENVIAVRATNLSSQQGLDRGLLLSLTLNQSVVSTSRDWRQRAVLDGGWPDADLSWLQPGFDDSAWGLSVEQAANGSPPWGFVAQVSANARWIWPYHSSTFPKPDLEPVLFRRSVYVTLDGGLSFTPSPCP